MADSLQLVKLLVDPTSLLWLAPVGLVASSVALFLRSRSEDVAGWTSSWAEDQLPWVNPLRVKAAGTDRTELARAHLPETLVRCSLLLRNEESADTPAVKVRIRKNGARWHTSDSVEVLHTPGQQIIPRLVPMPGGEHEIEIDVPAGLPPLSAWSFDGRTAGGQLHFEAFVGGRRIPLEDRGGARGVRMPAHRMLTFAALGGLAWFAATSWGWVLFEVASNRGLEPGLWPLGVILLVLGLAWLAWSTLLHPPPVVARGYLGWGLPARWPSRQVIPAYPIAQRPFLVHSRNDREDSAASGETRAARWLHTAIAAAEWLGATPLVDVSAFAGGARLESAMTSVVAEADVVVFLATPMALQSVYCHREIEEAKNLSKRIVTIACDRARWPGATDIPGQGGGARYVRELMASFAADRGDSGLENPICYVVETDADMYAAIVAVLSISRERRPDRI